MDFMLSQVLHTNEKRLFARLNTPAKIQDYLNTIPANFERGGETCMAVRRMLREKRAHCLEGALFAAAVLWYHGHEPLILDLKCKKGEDLDHIVTLFKVNGHWGALSKTNHAVLRYREPIYRTVRELALSYFHEYFTNKGVKTLRSYSRPFHLKSCGIDWLTSEEDLWDLSDAIDNSPHYDIVTSIPRSRLRKADKIEIEAGKLEEYTKN